MPRMRDSATTSYLQKRIIRPCKESRHATSNRKAKIINFHLNVLRDETLSATVWSFDMHIENPPQTLMRRSFFFRLTSGRATDRAT
jgi:hypothetical protein